MFSPESILADFPILDQKIHGRRLIYLDNAATNQKPQCVLDTSRRYYESINSNIHRGTHQLARAATEAFENARNTVAKHLNAASSDEVIFTSGTTGGINLAANILSLSGRIKANDEVLISALEHHSNIVPWQMLCQRTGAKLKIIPCDDNGTLDLDAFHEALKGPVKILALTSISNAFGTVNPIAEMTRAAKAAGAIVLIDAAQSIAHLPTDVQSIGADFLAFSGHKMCGPTGIGVLYGRRELLDAMPPDETGGGMVVTVTYEGATWKPAPERFEAGTPNIAGAVGLAAACDYLDGVGREAIARHDTELAAAAYQRLAALPGIRLLGPRGTRSGLVSFAFEDVHAHDVVTFADEDGVALRGGHHCNQPLMRKLGLASTTRASFYLYNGEAEIDSLVASLRRILAFFRA
jgi:cysteine desulfurase/selenocysteine lyase